jgi:hypothetical protein
MKIIKFLRKPYLSIVIATLVLYASCNQYDSNVKPEQTFDYRAYNQFKNSNHFGNILYKLSGIKNQSRQESTLEMNKQILATVNVEVSTNLSFPDELLSLSLADDVEQIYSTALNSNWMNAEEVNRAKNFANDIQMNGFDVAIENYENKIVSLNLSDEEFARENVFVNIIRTLNNQYPNLLKEFNSSQEFRGGWRCALACIGLVAATASLAGCATGAACALAVTLVAAAGLAVYEHCGVAEAAGRITLKNNYYVETI